MIADLLNEKKDEIKYRDFCKIEFYLYSIA
jgi:hypothetical protein